MVKMDVDADIVDISKVIPEKNIIVFSPHYDDLAFFLAGYVFGLKESGIRDTKSFTNINVFSRSNYQARQDEGNRNTSLERIKYAVGNRVIEDLCCLDELLGQYDYVYRLLGEKESQVRGKVFAESDMEFPHGMYEDFDECDWEILKRVSTIVEQLAKYEDTALVFPIAFKEHIDHFIVREAGLKIAKREANNARFYFAEDKPYGGISDETEMKRITCFVEENRLAVRAFKHYPQELIDLVFKHYISQVEEVYIKGINNRTQELMALYSVDYPVDRIYVYP
jgi:hypothetical protein